MIPDTARSCLVAVLDDEADARWWAAIREPADKGAKRAYDAIHELRVLLAALADSDPDVIALGVLAASGDVLGLETLGTVATYGRREPADPGRRACRASLSSILRRGLGTPPLAIPRSSASTWSGAAPEARRDRGVTGTYS
jgi:hypothetical protein